MSERRNGKYKVRKGQYWGTADYTQEGWRNVTFGFYTHEKWFDEIGSFIDPAKPVRSDNEIQDMIDFS